MTKKTIDKIVDYLKVEGPTTAKVLAEQFSLTTMGVRQHLQGLEEEGMLVFEDRKASRGRPTRYWSLTEKSYSLFPDRHDDLTSQLIESVKVVFGDSGLEQLIRHREEASKVLYQKALAAHSSVLAKLNALAKLRTEEGYVATVERERDHYWLLENHCPICAAASHCVNFCRSELQLFQWLFNDLATISREEHIIEGARRCAYKVVPNS
ncbi:helix-turn-helix transcriptional regulator [Shewanella psychrotolerans]|uniref:helix-turn-helix transcriptional regulator n=1 Tax=Shewanella psychrotolerans TaxID=2864206 RepID=UPI001C65E83E|nr:metalloregulator ArsR/SmtB family transcription factor [Shewanella psychrotolerans]QYK02188.1 transcriptional regulator [Shewanella psychrotolerans]